MYRWDFVAAYLQGSLLEGEVDVCSPAPGYGTAVIDGAVRMVPIWCPRSRPTASTDCAASRS
eukprot:5106248-Prymnesium_polylepis.1